MKKKEDLPALSSLELGVYRHYKSPEMTYEVIGVAYHSETLEPLVIYRKLYGERSLWARPHGMFTGTVSVGGKTIQRFAKIG